MKVNMKRGLKMWEMVAFILILITGLFIFNKKKIKKGEMEFPPNGEFVEVEGIKLHYISEGTGKPIVFLHGGILIGNDFKQVIKLAASQGYRAIAFDRPGYGFSERPSHQKVTPISQAFLIHQAIRKLGINEPIILAGHSWSGIMTLSYTLQFPDNVSGILLLGAAMYKEGYPAENGDILSKIVTTPILGHIILNTLLKTPLGKSMCTTMVKSTFAPEEPPKGYWEETYALGFRPKHFKANREDVLAFPKASMEISSQYKQIGVPTLIIVGEDDPFGTIEQGKRLYGELEKSKMKIIPHVSHMIPQLHPSVVMDGVKELACIDERKETTTILNKTINSL